MFANNPGGLHSCRRTIENIYLFYHLPTHNLTDIDWNKVAQNTRWQWIRDLIVGLKHIQDRGTAHNMIRKETVVIFSGSSPGAALGNFSRCSDSKNLGHRRFGNGRCSHG